MLGWVKPAAARASRWVASRIVVSLPIDGSSTLTATGRPSTVSSARQTSAIPPTPIRPTSRNRSCRRRPRARVDMAHTILWTGGDPDPELPDSGPEPLRRPPPGEPLHARRAAAVDGGLDQGEDRALERGGGQHLGPAAVLVGGVGGVVVAGDPLPDLLEDHAGQAAGRDAEQHTNRFVRELAHDAHRLPPQVKGI